MSDQLSGGNALPDQAENTDPQTVPEVVEEMGSGMPTPTGEAVADDATVPGSDTVIPGSDAPSRAGITGSGSGADSQGL